MQQVMQLRAMGAASNDRYPSGSPGMLNERLTQLNLSNNVLLSDYKPNIPTKEQLQFLNQQLSEALTEVIDSIENSQKRALTFLSTK